MIKSAYTIENQVYFEENKPGGRKFRRIAGGVSWPCHGLAGALVVVGEDLQEDLDFKTRHLWVLKFVREHQGESFIEAGVLVRAMGSLTSLMCVQHWYGMESAHDLDLREYNQGQARARKPRISLLLPPGSGQRMYDFEYYLSRARSRTLSQKTLHIGQGELSNALIGLPPDVSGVRFEDRPECSALFFACAGLDMVKPKHERLGKKWNGPADAVGGY